MMFSILEVAPANANLVRFQFSGKPKFRFCVLDHHDSQPRKPAARKTINSRKRTLKRSKGKRVLVLVDVVFISAL